MVKLMSASLESVPIWHIDSVGPIVERRLKFQSFYFHTVIIVNVVVSLLSGVLHAIPVEGDTEIFYTLAFFEEFFPAWKTYLCFFYRLGFIFLAVLMPAPFYLIIYASCHFLFQAIMGLEVLQEINKIKAIKTNQFCQGRIKALLIFCIKRHSLLNRYDKISKKPNALWFSGSATESKTN